MSNYLRIHSNQTNGIMTIFNKFRKQKSLDYLPISNILLVGKSSRYY